MVHDEDVNYKPQEQLVRQHFTPSTPRPFHIQPEPYASYPRPSNSRVTPKSPSASQPPPASKESGETATPANFIIYQVDGIVDKPAYKPTSQHKQQKPLKATPHSRYRDQFSYTLDPNDGYDVQVPPRIVYINERPRHPANYYVNTPTTEATPLIASPTPFHRHLHQQKQQQHQQYHDQHLYEQPEEVQPIVVPQEYMRAAPPTKPPSIHQHLTETTHIKSPSISSHNPLNHRTQSKPSTPTSRSPQIYLKPSREQTHQYHHSSTSPTRQVDRTERPIPQTSTTESMEEEITHPHHELQYAPQQQQQFVSKTALNEVPHYEAAQPLQYQTPKVQYVALPEQQPNHLSSTSLADVLQKLQKTNLLPQTLTAGNIDDSIKTLVEILNNLKNSQRVAEVPSQHVTDVPARQPYHPPQQNYGDYEEDYIDYNNEPTKDNTAGQLTAP